MIQQLTKKCCWIESWVNVVCNYDFGHDIMIFRVSEITIAVVSAAYVHNFPQYQWFWYICDCDRNLKHGKKSIYIYRYLGQGEGGEEINDEIGLEVARGDLLGIGDEFFVAVNTRHRGDEGGAEFEDHVEEEEEVGDGAADGDEDAEEQVVLHARLVPGHGDVEVEGVQKQCRETWVQKRAVPFSYELWPRVQYLVPPWYFFP